MLASLAMLALKGALRAAPGGSAPLFPSAPPHGLAFSGRDEKAGSSAEPESWIVRARLTATATLSEIQAGTRKRARQEKLACSNG